jgi:hypothetical protein
VIYFPTPFEMPVCLSLSHLDYFSRHCARPGEFAKQQTRAHPTRSGTKKAAHFRPAAGNEMRIDTKQAITNDWTCSKQIITFLYNIIRTPADRSNAVRAKFIFSGARDLGRFL